MRRAFSIAALFASACSFNNPGEAPPRGKIYFPTAIAIADDHLLVANSNFDIRYNAGSLQAYDLAVLNEQVDACLEDPEAAGCDCGTHRPCELPDTESLLGERGEVLIGSYASQIAFSPARARIYVPTRSNGGLTYIEFVDGVLDCGQEGRRCSASHIAGVDPNEQGVAMPNHPSSIAVGDAASLGLSGGGDFVLVGDENGSVSLFTDSEETGAPTLAHVRSGSAEVTSIATAGSYAYVATDSFLLRNNSSGVRVLGFADLSSQAFRGSYVREDLILSGFAARPPVRSLAFLPGSTTEFVAATTSSPSALVRVDIAAERQRPFEVLTESIVSLGTGPSKVQVGSVGTDPRVFAFVSCFDSREVMVVDVELGRLVSVIQGATGPFSLALDTPRARLYVGDFRSSTVRIVDLQPLVSRDAVTPDTVDQASPRVIAILGRPSEVQALQ